MCTNNSLLLFAANGKVWFWRPASKPELYAELPEAALSRFNDVIADPVGRVFCGVAPVEKGGTGSLWRMDTDNSFTCIEPTTAGMPNGMGFSPDLQYFYFTVTSERIIYRYNYEKFNGNVSDKTVFIKVPNGEGMPDGMTVDADGCIWSAQWNGSRLIRYTPTGKKLIEYNFTISKISCVTFGGKNYSELFVTTANYPWNESDYEKQYAGSVFVLKQEVCGLPEYKRII
jgi:D-xylono/L-arabinono-1,4-lactonase